ncbi:FitA-like ribbon-helix-helix domain-containing protein [Jiangella alkaliphila]|uniref:Antitoxin FitA-like ribbon-helix-helix domain-containing protein n=1 Tax=Jiangella alkaliphila TaxID=419479 RepID=A0A1H2JSQ2_9ACTN|nr:hypothetical protein [Jiangella alkaliphila]SDU59045.1 hypothetical protein SAMN04488563_2999 [Jiangella alkaliphila]
MAGEILQVRDVDSDDLAVLRERAAREGKSLSAYVRDLLHDEAMSPTNAEVVEAIAGEEPVEADLDEVRRYIEAERSW